MCVKVAIIPGGGNPGSQYPDEEAAAKASNFCRHPTSRTQRAHGQVKDPQLQPARMYPKRLAAQLAPLQKCTYNQDHKGPASPTPG